MSWLDTEFAGGYTKIQIAGADLPAERILNFADGFSVVDDSAHGRTNTSTVAASFDFSALPIEASPGTADYVPILHVGTPEKATLSSLLLMALNGSITVPGSGGPGNVTLTLGGSNALNLVNSNVYAGLTITGDANYESIAFGGNTAVDTTIKVGGNTSIVDGRSGILSTKIVGSTNLQQCGIYPDGTQPIIEWFKSSYLHVIAVGDGVNTVSLTLHAADNNHATNPAGDVVLVSGFNAGAGAHGKIKMQIKGTDVLTIAQQGSSNINLTLNGDYGGGFVLAPSAPTTGVAGRGVTISAGIGGTGNQNGGVLALLAGSKSGSGTDGEVQLCTPAGAAIVRVTTSKLSFYNVTPVTQPADLVAFTDNISGTTSRTLAAVPDPADTPATADVLRDDIVANVLPKIRNALSSLALGFNDTRTNVFRPLGLTA